LARYNIGIAALSETRFSGEDQLTESESGYTLFWSGKPEGVKQETGVGFAVKNTLPDKIECPTALYERIMTLRIPLSANRFITMISVYTPTLESPKEMIMSFYQALRSLITSIPKDEGILLLGDFNARVGCDHETWPPLGPYGIGKVNDNGLLLLQLCTELDLVITNTFSQQKKEHKATWFHPRSKHGHMIDPSQGSKELLQGRGYARR
jgi:exonuclease III